MRCGPPLLVNSQLAAAGLALEIAAYRARLRASASRGRLAVLAVLNRLPTPLLLRDPLALQLAPFRLFTAHDSTMRGGLARGVYVMLTS